MQKLRLTLLLIFGLFEISTACDNILRDCSRETATEGFELTILPNEEELRRMCPVIMEDFECVRKKVLKCHGKTPEEVAHSSDDPDAGYAELFIIVEALAKELCDEESNLHKSYVRTQPCIREYFDDPKTECISEAEAAYAAYKNLSEVVPAEVDETAMCLMGAYSLACMAHDLQMKCSEEARNVLTGIFQRLKLAKNVCSVSILHELKTNFLESLDMEPERKDIFALAFNVLKKRKK